MPLISSENEDIEDRGIQLVTRLEDWILTHPDDHDGAWHSPPTLEPIDIVGDWHRPLYGAVEAPRHQSLAPMPPSRIGRRDYGMNNPYAAIASSDDQDDTEDEAGDEVLLEPTTTTYIHGMTLLRLLIRIRTTMGDLWSHRSRALADAREWNHACMSLDHACSLIREAMNLADGQISRYF
jgi:hypothetical protein